MGVFLPQQGRPAAQPCLPHARGGVSALPCPYPSRGGSSPRSWGCFQTERLQIQSGEVFPTLVGVFPSEDFLWLIVVGLPHARGGVSAPDETPEDMLKSSPRSWGCFQREIRYDQVSVVFPTLVGVFLIPHTRRRALAGLPHARGGVSKKGPRLVSGVRSSPRSWGCCQDSLLHGGLSVRSGSYSMSCVLIQKR